MGSTEQHGPSGLLGIDFLSSLKIADAVSAQTQIVTAPVLPVGMAAHHMGFPGTLSLSPLTYIQMLTELFQSLLKHGFEKIYVINGHGGNIAPLTSAFCQCKQNQEPQAFKLVNWWVLPEVVAYEKEVFADQNGMHATCGEISVTRYTHPEAYAGVAFEKLPARPAAPYWPLNPEELKKHFPEGNIGSQPILSSEVHGKELFTRACDAIRKIVIEN